jgi:hypothetical protein
LVESELTEEEQPAKVVAYVALTQSAPDAESALAMLEQAKSFADARNIPIANLLLTEVGLRLSSGDAEGFQKVIETLTTRYGNEPEVMAQLQQMLMAYGLIGPDGSPRSAGGPPPGAAGPAAAAPGAAAQPGGIWTPDSGSPPPAAGPPSESGGGKLWIPGMD